MLSKIKSLIPAFIKDPINKIRNNRRWKRQYNSIINFYDNKANLTNEEIEVINYLKKIKGLIVFPYEYTSSWDFMSVKVFLDNISGLSYVLHYGKRLYFKREMSEIEIKGVYFGLLNEQSPKSPHLYLTDFFTVENNSVVADFGAAEGIFSLNVIDHVSKIYLFEPDPSWIEALYLTFRPWNQKVIIVNKFIGKSLNESTETVDHYFSNIQLDFIKADIEGSEGDMLEGAYETLALNKKMKLVITTYHKQFDFEEISNTLTKNFNFYIEHSYGFMLYYINNNLKPPYLRRGILRAVKNIN